MTKGIPWFTPEVGDADRDNLIAVLESGYINDGEWTRRLESRIACTVGVPYCVAVTSGTAALTLALMGLGIGRGDEVIVPDLTYVATANAVKLAGADVRLVDVEPDRFSIDPARILAAMTGKTRAIVAVDVNGRGCDYDRLEALCRDHGLVLVCDSAEALGSKWKGRSLGTYGNAGTFSFSPNKTVTSGQGGAIVTNDEGLYFRLRELKDQGRRDGGTGGDDLHPVLGYNFKLTNLHAAVALAQFDLLARRLAHFGVRDAWYQEILSDIPGIRFPPMSEEGEVRQWADVMCDDREEIVRALTSHNIGCRAFWFPIHRQIPYAAADDGFENSIEISQKGLWLPSNFSLTRAEAERVGQIIRSAAG
jgi:perosamine synthetase